MPSPTDPAAAAERADVRAQVLARVAAGPIAPAELLNQLGRASRRRSVVQEVIRELVGAGEIAYALEHGRTVLEPSFDRPVSVSARITLAPPGKSGKPAAGVLVRLAAGAAFGAGRHPTTRLALRGIDAALQPERVRPGGRVLDVGTGTGVLAIAAVALGMEGGLGIDLDPCAVAEARHNIRLNGMQDSIRVSDQPLEQVGERFALVAANLRSPSLVRLGDTLGARLGTPGGLVVSGMRAEERGAVLTALAGRGLEAVWSEEEGGWAAAVLEKTG
jgi:ribosomal protein L11 methyltransferase